MIARYIRILSSRDTVVFCPSKSCYLKTWLMMPDQYDVLLKYMALVLGNIYSRELAEKTDNRTTRCSFNGSRRRRRQFSRAVAMGTLDDVPPLCCDSYAESWSGPLLLDSRMMEVNSSTARSDLSFVDAERPFYLFHSHTNLTVRVTCSSRTNTF